jgi:hypothetical protein
MAFERRSWLYETGKELANTKLGRPNNMREIVNRFVSQLYLAKLKSLGFRRSGHTFRRKAESYVESFQIQGSAWNNSNTTPLILRASPEPWRFYVNVGVRFLDINDLDDSQQEHATGRIEGLVPESDGVYRLTAQNLEQLVEEVGSHIARAREVLPETFPRVRERAKRGLHSPLPVPSTWE